MNNKDILRIAMEQSAIDFNCSIDNFVNRGNMVVISKLNNGAKNAIRSRSSADLHITAED